MVLDIFVNVILPILVMVGLGAAIQRAWPMDIATLARLNIYLFVPAFLFVRVSESKLSWGDMGGIAAAVLVPMVLLTVLLYGLMRWRGASASTMAVIITGGLIFNAGNFGIPVAELMYEQHGTLIPGMRATGDGPAVQALVVMMSNLMIWLVGLVILSLAQGHSWQRAVANYFKLPMVYVLAAALLVRQMQWKVPMWLDYPLRTVAVGVVPLALVTLGAQLARRGRLPNPRMVVPVLGIKLLLLPAVTAGYVWATGLWPWPGAQLVIASAAPTAVNTLLITLEVKGDAEQAADCVFWTTLVSAATATIVIVWVLASTGAKVG
jgi:predicted permease